MSQTVYYSPWNDSAGLRAAMLLAFQPPVSVLTDMTKKIQRENNRDNFINCPAFINSIKNTFLLSSPTNCAVEVHGNTIIDTAAEKQMLGYLAPTLKAPSMLDSYTINLGTNWIFFSEHDQEIETRHPFLHHSPISNYGYYVPGNMNISSWFRPLEYAFQSWPNVQEFKVTQGDPLLYVNFPNDEKIVLKRFHLTEELFDASISCIRLKFYWREKNLKKLYNIFRASKIHKHIIREIKKNIME